MPFGDSGAVEPGNAGRQFKKYLKSILDKQLSGGDEVSASEGHEILFSRNSSSGQVGSLRTGKTHGWWVRRQIDRVSARNEVARLIDAQFDRQYIVTERWLLPNETLGDRLMKDSATQSGFSFNKLDDAALLKIAKRLEAIKVEEERSRNTYSGMLKKEYKRNGGYTYRVSHADLKTIYTRADEAVRKRAEIKKRNRFWDEYQQADSKNREKIWNDYLQCRHADELNGGPHPAGVTNLIPTDALEFGGPFPESQPPVNTDFASPDNPPLENMHVPTGTEQGWLPRPLPDAKESYRLGRLYNDKNSPDYDRYKALCCFIRAEQQGYEDTIQENHLGLIRDVLNPYGASQLDVPFEVYKICREGADGVFPDPDRAAHWLSVSAGDNQRNARDELRRLARHGDPDFQFSLYEDQRDSREGNYFYSGHYKRGAHWLLRAAEQGHEGALNELEKIKRNHFSARGLLRALRDVYLEGIVGVTPDLDEAVRWNELSKGRGRSDEEYAKFRHCLIGSGIPWKEARQLARRLAQAKARGHLMPEGEIDNVIKNGPGDLLFALSHVFREGMDGVPKDIVQAWLLLVAAVDHGDQEAALELARFVSEENSNVYFAAYQLSFDSGKPDLLFDAFCLLKAAALGHDKAQAILEYLKQRGSAATRFIISEYYRHGLDPVSVDNTESERWFSGPDVPELAMSLELLGYRLEHGPRQFDARAGEWINNENHAPTSADVQKAVDYYTRAIEQSDPNKGLSYPHGLRDLTRLVNSLEEDVPADLQYLIGRTTERWQQDPEDVGTAASWYLGAAKAGHADAQYKMFRLYRDGTGVRQDLPTALRYLVLAAEQEHEEALLDLRDLSRNGPPAIQFEAGELYRTGADGVEPNIDEAVSFYRSAAFSGYPAAQYHYGMCNKDGVGVPSNPADAARWLLRAAQNHHQAAREELDTIKNDGPPDMQFAVGELYRTGADGIEPNIDEARAFFEQADTAASEQNVRAEVRAFLGRIHYHGFGSALHDYDLARQYFEQADTDDLKAKDRADIRYQLGQIHYFGFGSTPQDYNRARQYLEQADTDDLTVSRRAMTRFQLGLIHHFVCGSTPQDYDLARKYFEQADTDDIGVRDRAFLRSCLGNIHYHGRGSTPKDYDRARQYFEQADTDDLRVSARAYIRYELGKIHYHGLGSTPQDCDRARQYFEQADTDDLDVRDRAFVRACLGNIHYFDYGSTPQDYDRARQYFEQADTDDLGAADRAFIRSCLGEIHYLGHGRTPQDYDRARRYFEQADTDDLGVRDRATVRYYLGMGKKEGNGTDIDLRGAARLIFLSGRARNQDAINELEACKQNGPPAYQFAMAELFRTGADNEAPDLRKAAGYYQRAAIDGHAGAQYRLGLMYRDGQVAPANTVQADLQAAIWLLRAAHQGHGEAVQTVNDVKRNGSPALRFALRELHAYGFENIAPDVSTASAFHSGPDEPAHADVLYGLGRLYQEGGLGADRLGIGGLEVDTLEAIDYFRRAIDQGQRWDALNALERIAQDNEGPASLYCEIGQIHEEGRGSLPVDLRTARRWYERAAEEGYAEAEYRLADCLLKGNEPDVSRAMVWLSRAAGNGSRDAVMHLQRIAEKGPAAQQLALARAYEQAVERRPPAEENNAMAFDGMQLFAQRERERERAEAIRQGKNTQLLKQAAGWYGRAAARGNAEAQYQYAICCREGREGGRDERQYVRWLTRSAENGHRDAQFALALFYQAAREQYDLADKAFIHWLRLAAAQGHELAGDLVATLNIGPDRPLRNQDTNPPGWWPSAMRLIDDEVNQLTALALVEALRADAPLQDEAAAGIVGIDNIDNEEPADGDEELVQQAFAVLIDVFEALRRRGEFNPSTELQDSLNRGQRALDEQVRVLSRIEEEGTADRRQELANLRETLKASLQLANEIQGLRRRNRLDTEGVVNAMCRERGLLPHE